MKLRVASFFAGIGGLDLGLERLGMETVFQCEWSPYCQRVLERHWPGVKRHGDITTLAADAIPAAEVWAGGFPCQPFSLAGDRKGSEDERHLWPVWFDLIRQVRPRYLLLENVPGLIAAQDGRVFGDLLRDLAVAGFDAEWRVLSARGVGAWHLRERVFVIAYHQRQRVQGGWAAPLPRVEGIPWSQDVRSVEDLRNRPDIPEPLVRGARNGVPNYVDRIRAIGNAVVPQVAEQIGRRILELERQAL